MDGGVDRIELDGSGDIESSFLEAKRKAPRAGKEVDSERPLVLNVMLCSSGHKFSYRGL